MVESILNFEKVIKLALASLWRPALDHLLFGNIGCQHNTYILDMNLSKNHYNMVKKHRKHSFSPPLYL